MGKFDFDLDKLDELDNEDTDSSTMSSDDSDAAFYGFSDEDDDEYYEQSKGQSKSKKQSIGGGLDKGLVNKILAVIGIVILVIIVLALVVKFTSNKDDTPTSNLSTTPIVHNTPAPEVTKVEFGDSDDDLINNIKDSSGTDSSIADEDEIVPGMIDFDRNKNTTTSPYVYSADDYIKDLNGNEMPAVYSVEKTTYENIFVNYESRRAIIDDGMEMYWIEIEYEGRDYRCQVPFSVFKALNKKGICVVQAEILHFADGEMIISYMTVNTEYLSLFK